MRYRKPAVAVAGLAALLAMGLVATGCAGKTSESRSKPAAKESVKPTPADPGAALRDAAGKLKTTPYKMTMEGEDAEGSGSLVWVLDVPSSSGTMTMKMDDFSMELLVKGRDLWIKATMPDVPVEWQHLSADKLPPKFDRQLADLSYGSALITEVSQIATARETGPGRFEGTLDLTKAIDGLLAADTDVKALGDKAKAVPFVAELDSDKRLTALRVDVPETADEPAMLFELTFSDYGVAPKVTPPAGAKEAPDVMYEIFERTPTS